MQDPTLTATLTALWFSMALLAAGYARTRNRSAWNWFFSTLLFGPIAIFLLVVWAPVESRQRFRVPAASDGADPSPDAGIR